MDNEVLYTPWRMKYILSAKENGCIFCFDKGEDEKHLVVHRTEYCFVILNIYPYNNGHIMVVPNRHVSRINDLNTEEINDVFSMVKMAEDILQKAYNPEGFNIGMNIGKVAGAGVESHLHVHIVPRWSGDTNFMTVCSGVRVIPEDLQETYKKLKVLFDNERL